MIDKINERGDLSIKGEREDREKVVFVGRRSHSSAQLRIQPVIVLAAAYRYVVNIVDLTVVAVVDIRDQHAINVPSRVICGVVVISCYNGSNILVSVWIEKK